MSSGFVLDSSVIVKWFKKGEEGEDIAIKILNKMLTREIKVVINEYSILEVV